MGIGAHVPVAREVLADSGHPGLLESLQYGAPELGNRARLGMESTISDHAARAMVDVQHRRKSQVHAVGAQLGRQHEPEFLGKLPRVLRIWSRPNPGGPPWRNSRDPRERWLRPPSVITRNDQRRAQSVSPPWSVRLLSEPVKLREKR